MRILIVFADMIRPNRLSTFNNSLKTQNPFEKTLVDLGGTIYKNCFTEGPDTPRALATIASGLPPYLNGCNTRVKWPKFFLKKELKTIFDLFIDKNYKLSFFSNPNERETGMFPEHIYKMNIHNTDFDLKNFLSKTKLEEKHLMFISLPDFHWSFDDNGYTKFGEKKAYSEINKSFSLIFENFKKDDFDHIFIFSDHGFKFNYQIRSEKKYLLMDEDRTNVLMVHRKKGESSLKINEKLCSLNQVYPTINSILNNQNSSLSLINGKSKDYIVIEDHLDFAPSINQNIELWSIVFPKQIYIRTLNSGYILERENRKITKNTNDSFDKILKKESTFSKYYDEYEKVNRYNKYILKQTNFMHGGRRLKQSKVLIWINSIYDLLNAKLK